MSMFNIYREDVFNCCKRAMRRTTFNPLNRISVLFTDVQNNTEGAVDEGGPRREMFRLLLTYLKESRIFEGAENEKNLCFCNESLDNNDYFEAGRIISLAIVHAGFGPRYLSNTLFAYLVNGAESVKPDPGEIVDLEILKDIKALQSSTDLNQMRDIVLDSTFFQIAGFKNVTDFEQKNKIIERAVEFYMIHRMRPALDQFAEGLNTMEFLAKMKRFPDELKTLLCHQKNVLNAAIIKSMFLPSLSETGSNARNVETRILAFWWDYLLDCEEPDTEVKIEEILWFATGAQAVPVLGFEHIPTLEFLHNDESPYPKANTCSLKLYLPIHRQYDDFKRNMNYGIRNGMVFGFA